MSALDRTPVVGQLCQDGAGLYVVLRVTGTRIHVLHLPGRWIRPTCYVLDGILSDPTDRPIAGPAGTEP